MIITTSGNETQLLIEKALSLSSKHEIEYHSRNGKSLEYLLDNIDPQIFVVNNMRGLSYYEQGREEAFYHPNMAFHRIVNLKKGCRDSMAAACKLESGMSFFDGTLGLASDSLTASYVVGEGGTVTATEKSLPIYILVEEGLNFYAVQHPEMASAVNRISIKNTHNLDFLCQCRELSFDIVYFDFMFSYPVAASNGIQIIRNLASHDEMTEEHLSEALRVARKKVVVKSDRDGIGTLLKFGFIIDKESQKRSFYYAVLEK